MARAFDEMPMTCTSLSTALLRGFAGVWNSGPTVHGSTADIGKAVAMTLARDVARS